MIRLSWTEEKVTKDKTQNRKRSVKRHQEAYFVNEEAAKNFARQAERFGGADFAYEFIAPSNIPRQRV